jgi:hypothetical protein
LYAICEWRAIYYTGKIRASFFCLARSSSYY